MVGARCRGRCEVARGNPDWVWPKCGAMQLMRCSLNDNFYYCCVA